ncbi:putative flavanone 3-dioxygenase [Rosa chinensis]|uniref:Putative flavanone 3-dioxygenase n=1 Tax=Rosa chinensis TaxID=74649 RepID=A0A2P6PVE4_ROSCH|nr:putative flavanone 3-dioxygenase [Rosa chinensis]
MLVSPFHLISNRSDLQFVPESYILPPGTRPGNTQVSVLEVIPVIDFQLLGTNRPQLIKQIIEASQKFGFFQVYNILNFGEILWYLYVYNTLMYRSDNNFVVIVVNRVIFWVILVLLQLINHGVEDNLLHKVLDVANEFFEQPYEDKASMYSEDVEQSCRLYTSIDYNKEKVHFWRDNLRHPCHPLEQHIHFWPQKPPQYREVVGSYSVEARKLSILLLDLIGEGLGLESEFFGDELTEVQLMGINYYPPCPDPSLTLGLPKHSDVNLITLLLQGEEVHGLQVLKDGQWLAVEPVPNAFVVNIGHTLQVHPHLYNPASFSFF